MDKINKVTGIIKIGAIVLFTFVSVILYMVFKPNLDINASKRQAEQMIEDNKKHLENATRALGRI